MDPSVKILEIQKILESEEDIVVAILFGSLARGDEGFESDLDLGISTEGDLTPDRKMTLIEQLAAATGRPVDLVDLRNANPIIRTQILTKGRMLVKRDSGVYADLVRSMIYDNTDVMPYYNRILKERRERFIRG